jgi:uncharacterized membrane protein
VAKRSWFNSDYIGIYFSTGVARRPFETFLLITSTSTVVVALLLRARVLLLRRTPLDQEVFLPPFMFPIDASFWWP